MNNTTLLYYKTSLIIDKEEKKSGTLKSINILYKKTTILFNVNKSAL